MKKVDKIIFHYTNGKSYTLTNTYIDCYIDWDNMRVGLLNSNSFDRYEKSNMVTIPEDCVAITAVGSDRVTSIWENPRYITSVKISVMTANARCKKNRKSKTLEESFVKPVIITLLILLIFSFLVPIVYIKTIIYFNGDPVLWDQQFKFLVALPVLIYTFSLIIFLGFLRKRGIIF